MSDILPGLHAAPNIHPLLVHLPIALMPVALLFWCLALWRRRDDLFAVGRWMLYLGTLGAVFAALTGLWAADQIGHDSAGHELVHVHRDYMLITTALAIVVAAAAYATRKRESRRTQWLLVAAIAIVNGMAGLGADRGALLVFGYGVGTQSPGDGAGTEHGHDDEHRDSHIGPDRAPGSASAAHPARQLPQPAHGDPEHAH